MTELPKRKKNNYTCINQFSKLLSLSNSELEQNITKNIYIENYKELIENYDFFEKLIDNGYMIYSKDYNVLKYIHDNCDKELELALLDDFENKDRSYIDMDSFSKSPLIIPLSYALWVNTDKDLHNHQTMNFGNLVPSSQPGVSPIKIDDLKRIKEEVYKLGEKCKDLDDVEKTILVSDFLQDRVQYIEENNISHAKDGIYITSGRTITPKDTGYIPNILFNGFGVCKGISSATTILLNNPILNVNVRNARNSMHIWNIVKIDDKYYYVDNTWNITRNPDRYDESLKAKSFSSEYLLFGENRAKEIGHHIPDFSSPVIEQDDYDRDLLNKKVKKLQYIVKYTDYEKPRYESHKKVD